MINLEFLGLDASGEKLTFNDADGNRYETAISDELRGALRKDRKIPDPQSAAADAQPRPASPKEIQAYFRAGMSVAQVSEICTLPPLQLAKLASPIIAERKFIANQARHFQQNHDSAGMSVDELVTSRLINRGVNISTIEWDAMREAGSPWILIARYLVADKQTEARWKVNSKAQIITPLNDEATWLTDTPIPTPNDPWRPLNIPQVSEINQAQEQKKPASAQADLMGIASEETAPQSDSAASTIASTASNAQSIDIDAMLASLDEQRGVAQPLPQYDEMNEFEGAHPAYSEPENAQDAQILQFPSTFSPSPEATESSAKTADQEDASIRPSELAVTSESNESDQQEDQAQALPGMEQTPAQKAPASVAPISEKRKQKTRRGRPEMPSWDEIIYGYSKDSE